MSAGYAHATPWGISLDGLLASEIWEHRKAQARAGGDEWVAYDVHAAPSAIELPLARCPGDGGDRWHWAATFAWPEDEIPGPHVQTWTGRADQHALAQIADQIPTHVDPDRGRYRSWVMPLPLTVARTLVWRAVGDAESTARLLDSVAAIGKKRASGHGLVLDWSVDEMTDADEWEFGHLHPDGTLGRTVPPTCLTGRSGIEHGGQGCMGLRPPYMHPQCRADVLLPAA
ncbi:hypothetical protein GS896_27415 [Rhodococcus hoagii]|nr:hypothetical protein [Prescottella equi]MBM4653981.1 hypothetical protein [Prescottella equi]NKR23553.1 hypothetical protein [Prescottella equi]NKT56293.1 hypothetical protein [Prescottella equi]NKU37545.1 hypothetical protein [Prescottella equi]